MKRDMSMLVYRLILASDARDLERSRQVVTVGAVNLCVRVYMGWFKRSARYPRSLLRDWGISKGGGCWKKYICICFCLSHRTLVRTSPTRLWARIDGMLLNLPLMTWKKSRDQGVLDSSSPGLELPLAHWNCLRVTFSGVLVKQEQKSVQA